MRRLVLAVAAVALLLVAGAAPSVAGNLKNYEGQFGPVLGRRRIGQKQAREQVTGHGNPATPAAPATRSLLRSRNPKRAPLAFARKRERLDIR